MPFTSQKPESPKSLGDVRIIPEATASIFSLITFSWITSLLGLGYARRLEATDLYKLQSERGADHMANKITESFAHRMIIANEYNERLANGQIKPGLKVLYWTIVGNRVAKEKKWRDETLAWPKGIPSAQAGHDFFYVQEVRHLLACQSMRCWALMLLY